MQAARPCPVCGQTAGKTYSLREMQFGTREEFDYILCSCGTMRVREIPDLSKHYPVNYYSYSFNSNDKQDFSDMSAKERLSRRLAVGAYLGSRNPLGHLILKRRAWLRNNMPRFLPDPPSLRLTPRSSILDVGCGAGEMLAALRLYGFRDLTGVDPFLPKDITPPLGVNLVAKEISEIGRRFDFVMSHHSIEHTVDPKAALLDIRKILKPNGFALVRTLVMAEAFRRYGVHWNGLDPPRHITIFSEQSFRSLAESSGFKVERVVYDSNSWQFWVSEQYRDDIPFVDPRSHYVSPRFTDTN